MKFVKITQARGHIRENSKKKLGPLNCTTSKEFNCNNKEMANMPKMAMTSHRRELCSEDQHSKTANVNIDLNPNEANESKGRRKLNSNQRVNQLLRINLKNNNLEKNIRSTNHILTEYFPLRRSLRKINRTVLEEKQRAIEQCIRNNVEDGLTVQNFSGKGRGIATKQSFSKGDFVIEYKGELIDIAEARRREQKYAKRENTGCYMYYFKHKDIQYCIDATVETPDLGRLVNHSRSGNLMPRVVTVDGIPRVILFAKKDILPGEEVTYDYGDQSKESLKYHPWLAT